MAVRALWYSRGVLSVLDQRALPGATRILRLRTLAATAEAIRTLTVRGAPSIGVAAAEYLRLVWKIRKFGIDSVDFTRACGRICRRLS